MSAATSSLTYCKASVQPASRSRSAGRAASATGVRGKVAKSLASFPSFPQQSLSLRTRLGADEGNLKAQAKVGTIEELAPATDEANASAGPAKAAAVLLPLAAAAVVLCVADPALAADPSGSDMFLIRILGFGSRAGCAAAAFLTFAPNVMMTSSGNGGAVGFGFLADIVWVLGAILPGSVTQSLVLLLVGGALQAAALGALK